MFRVLLEWKETMDGRSGAASSDSGALTSLFWMLDGRCRPCDRQCRDCIHRKVVGSILTTAADVALFVPSRGKCCRTCSRYYVDLIDESNTLRCLYRRRVRHVCQHDACLIFWAWRGCPMMIAKLKYPAVDGYFSLIFSVCFLDPVYLSPRGRVMIPTPPRVRDRNWIIKISIV